MSRHGRSSSIPIPRTVASSTSPNRNIESVISIPFSAGVTRRPRFSAVSIPQSSTLADGSGSYGVRGSSSFATSPSTRPTARSLTLASAIPNRGSPRSTGTFEPRVIRADTARSPDNPCLPSSSTSPTRIRRSPFRASSAVRNSPGRGSTVPPAPLSSFPRPAYLEHSSLRHLLHTEAPPGRKVDSQAAEVDVFFTRPHSSMSPPSDSDDESNVSVPRDHPLPIPHIVVASSDSFQLPTRWSEQERHNSLSVSADGRDLNCHGAFFVGFTSFYLSSDNYKQDLLVTVRRMLQLLEQRIQFLRHAESTTMK
jgi:Ran-binding protein 9/10